MHHRRAVSPAAFVVFLLCNAQRRHQQRLPPRGGLLHHRRAVSPVARRLEERGKRGEQARSSLDMSRLFPIPQVGRGWLHKAQMGHCTAGRQALPVLFLNRQCSTMLQIS